MMELTSIDVEGATMAFNGTKSEEMMTLSQQKWTPQQNNKTAEYTRKNLQKGDLNQAQKSGYMNNFNLTLDSCKLGF